MRLNEISGAIVDSADESPHSSALGPGLLEEQSIWLACVHELNQRGFHTAVQLPLPVVYDAVRLDLGFRLDILVEKFCRRGNQGGGRDQPSPSSAATNLSSKLKPQTSGIVDQLQRVVHLRDGIRRNGELIPTL